MSHLTIDYLMKLAEQQANEQESWLSRMLRWITKDHQSYVPGPTALAPHSARSIIQGAIRQYLTQRANIPVKPQQLLQRIGNLVHDMLLAIKSPLGEHPYFHNIRYEGLVYHPTFLGSYQRTQPPTILIVAPKQRLGAADALTHELVHGYLHYIPQNYKYVRDVFRNLPESTRSEIVKSAMDFFTSQNPYAPIRTLIFSAGWMTEPGEIMANAVAREVTRRLFGRVVQGPQPSFSARLIDYGMHDPGVRRIYEEAINVLLNR